MIIKGRDCIHNKLRRKGFTLVELLVVIGIIGILATTIMVNLSSGRDKAKAASVLQSLRSVQSTASSCLDSGGTVNAPTVTTDATSGKQTNGGNQICSLPTVKESWPLISDVAAEWHYSTVNATKALRNPSNSIAKSILTDACPAGQTCADNCVKTSDGLNGNPPQCLACKLPGTTGGSENAADCTNAADLQQVTAFNGGQGYGTSFQYGAYSDANWVIICNQTSCKKAGF